MSVMPPARAFLPRRPADLSVDRSARGRPAGGGRATRPPGGPGPLCTVIHAAAPLGFRLAPPADRPRPPSTDKPLIEAGAPAPSGRTPR